jgi:hypothetical protein
MATSATVKTYQFDIALAGMETPDPALDDQAWGDRMASLFDALSGRVLSTGLEDVGLCGIGSHGDVFYLTFELEAESLGKAIGLAVEAIEGAGLAVSRVEIEEHP